MEINKDLIKQIKIVPLIDTLQLEKISDSEYFSERYRNYISNSRLNILVKDGVKAFFEGLKSEYNPSFQFGTNLHALILEPEEYELIDCVFKPTAKAGIVADYLYNDKDGTFPSDEEIIKASNTCNYYKDKLNSNRLKEFKLKAQPYWRDRYLYEYQNPPSEKIRIYTDEKSVGLLKSCINSINNDKRFENLLHPEGVLEDIYSANERAILLDVQVTIPNYEPVIYHLKSKLDNFTIDKESNIITVNDLKTTSRLINEFDLTYYSYQRELALYSYLLKLCSKKFFNLENPTIKGNFLVVSTIPDFRTEIYPMTDSLFSKGWKEIVYLLKTVAYYNIVENYDFA